VAAFFLEVKTAIGRLSQEQTAFFDALAALGIGCAICRSIDDARRAFASWNIETRESRQ
jgi:hypothetical protein